MKLHMPESLDEAIGLLAASEETRCLAGGQTLVAMMNANLVFPDALVSLRRLSGLKGIERQPDGSVTIGAMTTHRSIAEYSGFAGAQTIVGIAAGRIAHPPIRNVGTIGGSIAFADPAADFPTALNAAAALIELQGPQGVRTLPTDRFFVNYLTTALMPCEIVTRIHLPPGPPGARVHYDKIVRVDGDLAVLSAAVVLSMQDGVCTYARLAVGACGPTPVHVEEADRALVGGPITADGIVRATEALVAACRPFDDFRATAAYRLRVLPKVLRRAIEAAAGLGA